MITYSYIVLSLSLLLSVCLSFFLSFWYTYSFTRLSLWSSFEADRDDTDSGDVDVDGDDDDVDGHVDSDGNGISLKSIAPETKCTNRQTKFRNKMFCQLVDYKAKHQTTNIPNYSKEDPVMKQPNWLDLLKSIGFFLDIHNTKGMKMYQRLIT